LVFGKKPIVETLLFLVIKNDMDRTDIAYCCDCCDLSDINKVNLKLSGIFTGSSSEPVASFCRGHIGQHLIPGIVVDLSLSLLNPGLIP
jgi:hypothetical protein